MKRNPLLVVLMAGLIMGALWLALPTTASAQCGGNPSEPPCPPAAEREKKATATERPVTPTPTLTQTPKPTPTGTATPLPVVAVDAEAPAPQRGSPKVLAWFTQGNLLLLLLMLLLAAILGFGLMPIMKPFLARNDGRVQQVVPGAPGGVMADVSEPDMPSTPAIKLQSYASPPPDLANPPDPEMPGMAHPPEPVAPALPKLTEIAIHGQSPADQDGLGKDPNPISIRDDGMANAPDGDVPVEDAPDT